ncbi:DUF3566 domain-containing protein [Intrasporangium sp.]|uniref:DUF3566 domain-containing protein n=1 Tax=Intrasporangium sp. TaxID=1925024 RepID=UPI003221C4FC
MSTSSSEGVPAGAGYGPGSSTRHTAAGASPGPAGPKGASAAQRSVGPTQTAPTQAVRTGEAGSSSETHGAGQARITSPAPASTQTAAQARPARKGPRRVRLAVARVDPWSVMKMSFLLSVAIGIAGVVLTAVLWMILSTMNVFNDIEGVLQSLQTATSNPFSIKDYIGFGRIVSLSIVIGVIDVILMTAIATIFAFLYNICSALVGGVQLTLTDD